MGAYTLLMGLKIGTVFPSKKPFGNSHVLFDNLIHKGSN